MRVFVAVNHVHEIGERQTTALIIAALARKGHQVLLAGAAAFSIIADGEKISVCTLASSVPADSRLTSCGVQAFARSAPKNECFEISLHDLILIRTNPGRDSGRIAIHESFLDVCRVANSRGIHVVNAPDHLKFFASKASLLQLDPKFFPASIVSSHPTQIADFIRNANQPCVIKPLVGSRGQNVIRIAPDMVNLEQRVANILSGAAMIAQHFVAADQPGDKRIVVCGGEILEIDGQIGGIERRPAADDFRGNLHAGGTPYPVSLSPSSRWTAQFAAKLLHDQGIWLAGVDLIGDKIIEFNVFSTGGLYFAEKFSGVSFSDEIAARLATEN